MNRFSRKAMNYWVAAGTRFLPFADAATAEVPLGRLLRLSLFQVSVGMALTLLVGTLNRVMIVELGVPGSLVGVMIALPLVFAPFRALIGFRSDMYRSALGWKRVPFIFRGSMVQFGGLAIMPFALLVLSGGGDAARAPHWVGIAAAGLAFLLTGAGLHTIQTVGLALATDLAPQEKQPQVVGLMYVMLLLGMIGSALSFGGFLADFSPFRLVQVIQASALATIVLNSVALWKQESRGRNQLAAPRAVRASFGESWTRFMHGSDALRRLVAVGVGTMAFSMEDVLLEPYGGQVLHLAVGQTTRLTATLALGGLCGFWLASRILSRGADPFWMASRGCLVGLVAFGSVILAAPFGSIWMFGVGTFLIGFGAGLFGHGTLTATMRQAPKSQAGLALGAWGAVQATAAGIAIALGGILHDTVSHFEPVFPLGTATGYDFVYLLELCLLCVTLVTMFPLIRAAGPDPLAALATATSQTTRRTVKSKGCSMKLSRIFNSAEAAAGVAADLRNSGFRAGDIELVTAENGWMSAAMLKEKGVSGAHAEADAAALREGKVLLLVNPLLGYAKLATHVMGLDGGAVASEYEDEWGEAAPLSGALGLPLLIDNPAPFSKFWNMPALMKRYWFFSNIFGLPLLSKRQAPAPQTGAVAHKAAPLSSAIGLPTLSKNPTPLSSLFKLPVLLKK